MRPRALLVVGGHTRSASPLNTSETRGDDYLNAIRVIVSFGDVRRNLIFLARRLKPYGRFGRKAGVEEVDLALSDNRVLHHFQR